MELNVSPSCDRGRFDDLRAGAVIFGALAQTPMVQFSMDRERLRIVWPGRGTRVLGSCFRFVRISHWSLCVLLVLTYCKRKEQYGSFREQ
jgi:hypothetical protein